MISDYVKNEKAGLEYISSDNNSSETMRKAPDKILVIKFQTEMRIQNQLTYTL